jgi:pimeloyl-ACP methyl ester carboxylesterase
MNAENPFFCHEGARCTEIMIKVDPSVSIRVISYEPSNPVGNKPIVLLGGLSTLLESLGDIICGLSADFPIHYIETREKSTSQIQGEVAFDLDTMVQDVLCVLQVLGLSENEFDVLSYSLGGALVLNGYPLLKPSRILLLEPSPTFNYPWWALKFIRSTLHLNLTRFRFVANWYMRNFVIDKNEDPEMVRISALALNNADPFKLRRTILAIACFTVWDKLAEVRCPVLLMAASKDKMHHPDEISRMVATLPNCRYVDLETNRRSHSPEAMQVLRSFLLEPLIS